MIEVCITPIHGSLLPFVATERPRYVSVVVVVVFFLRYTKIILTLDL